MEVKTVTISMGRTVNRGNFENTRYDVSITATIPPEEFDTDGAEALETTCRHELVMVLSGDLLSDLEGMDWTDFEGNALSGEGRVKRALASSPIFRHMRAVDELLADSLLNEFIDGEVKWGTVNTAEAPLAELEISQMVVIEMDDDSADPMPFAAGFEDHPAD
ncbi:MAG: hypothetical protein K8L97_01570 [Anaerolineae bacterium]|nr:hypothetical protein [Anaerolineae bacterium]